MAERRTIIYEGLTEVWTNDLFGETWTFERKKPYAVPLNVAEFLIARDPKSFKPIGWVPKAEAEKMAKIVNSAVKAVPSTVPEEVEIEEEGPTKFKKKGG